MKQHNETTNFPFTHGLGDADSNHSHPHKKPSNILLAVIITFAFALVEVSAGFVANSLALISDAGHMLTDSFSLVLALIAQIMAKRPPSAKHTYGLGRSEAIVSFVNSIFMLLVVGRIAYEAIERFFAPVAVQGSLVLWVATLGLVVNIIVFFILSRGEQNLNIKAAVLHVIGDLLGSVAAIIAGLVITYTGWMPIDPILSLLVCALILTSTLRLIRDSLHVLMEGVPKHIDMHKLLSALQNLPGVMSVHDLHVWEMNLGEVALTAHVTISREIDWYVLLNQIRESLAQNFAIEHITIQPELDHFCDLHQAKPNRLREHDYHGHHH